MLTVNVQATAAQQLKDHTEKWHLAVEASLISIIKNINATDGYIRLLKIFYVFFSWRGNPNEAVQFEPDKKRYHPRASFRQWQETVRGFAVPWEKEELEIAENFRIFVVDYTLNRSK